MSILAGPVFLLSAAAVLAAMLLPALLAPRKDFGYAVLYDGLFEVAAVYSSAKDVGLSPSRPDANTSGLQFRAVLANDGTRRVEWV